MFELRVWKLVNWNVQVVETGYGFCEPDIHFDETVNHDDELGLRKTLNLAMDRLKELDKEDE